MSTATSGVSLHEYDAKKYWTTNNHRNSARLHLQHWLYNRQFGWLLHPSIPVDKPKLKIADIACGNGAWLIELSHHIRPDAEFVGLDISANNFPAKEWLPKNTRMEVLDITGDIPEHLHGVFDIVAVRAFISAIRNNDTTPFLNGISKLLKPGGYFQWVDCDMRGLTAIAPNDRVSTVACEQMVKLVVAWGEKANAKQHKWLDDIPVRLQRHGLSTVEEQVAVVPPELYKPWNDALLWVWEQARDTHPPAAELKAGGTQGMSREEYGELFEKMLKEMEEGAVLNFQKMIVVISRKEM